ncbi:hypothetical protein H6P81_020832 [Aristolochia fimbriata]|uniref:C3H1-type domain-containing protein n=1 Tax=Aristolochia fimbriata TaxID=158543 RepID=A0AAV7DZZ8_ARIFI|nr:hypothetical protein H6P81_020832 [Aristolochia fimbriata]
MFGHRQLRDSLGLRPRLKSTTVCTLLHIFSHCVDDSRLSNEAPEPDIATKPLPVSSRPSESDRLCTELLSETPVNSCLDNPITSSNPEHSAYQNGAFSRGSDCAGNLGQVTHGLVDYASFQVDDFSIDNAKLADELNTITDTNEISCGIGVVVGIEDIDIAEYEKLLADTDTLNAEGSLAQNLHVMQGVTTDRGVCLSNKEIHTMSVENEQTTNRCTLAVDCGAEALCGETSPGKTRNLVCKEAQYKEILDKGKPEIANFIIVKDSTAGENPELDVSQNCTGELCQKTPKERETLENLNSSDTITNPSSMTVAISTSSKHDFVNLTGDREIEDGEISDDSGIPVPLLDALLEDASASEAWRPESTRTSDLNRNGIFPLGHKSQTEFDNVESVFGGEGIGGQSERGLPPGTSKIRGMTVAYNSLNAAEENAHCSWNKDIMHDEHARGHNTVELQKAISEVGLTQNQREQSAEKNVKIREKKKRTVTEGRKSKKKLAKKRKRAEINRKSGVKRLKLEPITKPKVVSLCKYYLKGRCKQGDKCNFSHDTVPLTKSQPCTFFAMKSCLKGEDCPFDHELSKYPCHNFTFNGTCIRGDSCLFSHKVPVSEGLPKEPNDSENVQKQLNSSNKSDMAAKILFKRTSPSVPSPLRNSLDRQPKEQLVEKRPRPSFGAPPEGITFLSFGKPPENLSKSEPQNASTPKSVNTTKPFRSLASPLPSHLSANSSTGGLKNSVNLSQTPQCISQPRAKLKSDDVKNQRSSCPSESQSKTNGVSTQQIRKPENGANDASSILEEFLFGALM